jgi:hypothetical protein
VNSEERKGVPREGWKNSIQESGVGSQNEGKNGDRDRAFPWRRVMGDYKYEEKESFDGTMVRVLGETFEEGSPQGPIDWRAKLASREERMGFLKTALRYWYSKEWYGSDKRKEEAS